MQKLNRRFGTKGLNLIRPKIVFPAVVVILLISLPFGAKAQFGLDPCCAIISVGLKTISGLLSSVVAKPLSTIQQIQQQTSQFEQQIIYPATAIANAKGSQIFHSSVARAVGALKPLLLPEKKVNPVAISE